MTISYGAAGTYYTGTSTSHAIAAPSGIRPGSVVVIAAYVDGASDPTITLPTGFSHAEGSPVFLDLTGGSMDQNHRLVVAWHRASSAEAGPYTLTLGSSRYVEAQAHRYDGVIGTGTPFDSPTDSDGTDASVSTTPAVNITTAGPVRYLLHAGTNWAGGTWTAPAGFTKRQQGGVGEVTLADESQTAAGASGSITATTTGSNKSQAWLGGLIPGGTTVLSGSSTIVFVSVQVAWGADLTASSSTWVWSDVTHDVLVNGGEQVTYRVGRSDEAASSQPAECRLRLDNRNGDYSFGPQASNWPYLRRNTPLRIQVAGDISPTATPFQGFIDSWQPDWDTSGEYAVVNVSASGIMRRLTQSKQPVLSSYRRALRARIGGNLLEYWPMEDNKDATSFCSDISGHNSLVVNSLGGGIPKFAESTPFPCSDRLPNINYAWLDGPVSPYTYTGTLQVRALVDFPANGMNDATAVLNINMDLSTTVVQNWQLGYGTGGTLRLRGYDVNGGVTGRDTGNVAFDVDGQKLRVGFYLTQNGANVDYKIFTLVPGSSTASNYSGTFNTVTIGTAVEVNIDDGTAAGNHVIGHVTLQNAATSLFEDSAALYANVGEGAIDRIGRLCTENSITTTVYSDGRPGPAMGPQSVAGLLALLRECEVADQGVLQDGLDSNLVYVAHNEIVNQGTRTLDASAGRLRDIAPVDDDQTLRNIVTATRSGGGTITSEDTDGPLGTDTVGDYDDSVTVNCETDDQLPDYAGWFINLGTVEGYRFPHVTFDLRDLTSSLAKDMLALTAALRYDVSNLASVRSQFPTGTVRFLTYGWSGAFDKHRWEITHNTGPYDPWNAILLDESDAVHGLRPDTAGSTLASDAAAGATSLSVTVSSGPLWTTDSGDMSMTVWVGDMPVTVSAISGGSSPQTFTCTATTLARTAGVEVSLPRPVPVLDIDDNSGN